MGTKKGSFAWVVAMLGLASACTVQHGVGSGEAGGAAGSDDGENTSGDGGTSLGGSGPIGGSGQMGGSGSATGGSGTAGGTSLPQGGGGPLDFPAGNGAGGSASEGSGGSGPVTPGPGDVIGQDCEAFLEGAPSGSNAEPEQLWDRVTRVVAGETLEFPDAELEEPAEMVSVLLDPISSLTPPPGLRRFMDRWAFENEGLDDLASRWGGAFFMHGGSLPGLFTPIGDEEEGRAGFASEVAFLSTFPTAGERARVLLRSLLCVEFGIPPSGSSDTPVPSSPGKTRRQTIEDLTSNPSCAGCHSFINPLGFSLEHFDAEGAYQEEDSGLPVDASGAFTVEGVSFSFESFTDLAPQLAASPDVAACVTRSLFQYALAEGIEDEARVPTQGELDYALCEFDRNDYSGRKLLETIVGTPSFMLE